MEIGTLLMMLIIMMANRCVKPMATVTVYCPAGYEPIGKYCFKSFGFGSKFQAEQKCSSQHKSTLFEIHSWSDQRAMEKFMKDRNIKNAAWLDGTVRKMPHREQVVSFHWRTSYFPQLKNFKNHLSSDTYEPCVVIDPKIEFQWARSGCRTGHIIVCVLRSHLLSHYKVAEKGKAQQPSLTI